MEWEIHIFLFFWRQRPRNQEICKSQREITIFLLFWSGKSLFSCFFWRRRPSKPENLQITTGDHPYFLVFFGGDDPRNRKSVQMTTGDHYFLFLEWEITCSLLFGQAMTLETGNLQITTGDHYFLAFLEWEIPIFLCFFAGDNIQKSKKIVISRCDLQIFGFRGSSPAQKAREK